MFSMSSASILPMKLTLATISVRTPASGPKPKILTKKMATITSWKVRLSARMARATR